MSEATVNDSFHALGKCLKDAKAWVEKYPKGSSTAPSQLDIQDIEETLDDANEYLRSIEVEYRLCDFDAAKKKQTAERLSQLKKEYQSYWTSVASIKLTAPGAGAKKGPPGAHNRMQNTQDKIGRQNAAIASATGTVAALEGQGADIMEQLQLNKEKIVSAQQKADVHAGQVDEAAKVTKNMTNSVHNQCSIM